MLNNSRIDVHRVIEVNDPHVGTKKELQKLSDMTNIPCNIQPDRGRESFDARRDNAIQTHKILGRSKHKFYPGDIVFDDKDRKFTVLSPKQFYTSKLKRFELGVQEEFS